jgi:hypothetical protein
MVYTGLDTGFTFTRATSDAPGAITATGPNRRVFWSGGMAGQCSIACWRPSASFTNSGWVLHVRGGLGYNPGERGAYDASAFDDFLEHFIARGYVVFSIDYPGNASNLAGTAPMNDLRPLAMWPDAVFWVGRCIQEIKDNADSTTTLGATLLGSGNSINPNFGVYLGNSWGGTIGLMLACMPDSLMARFASPYIGRATNVPRSSHRMKVVATNEAQTDLEQFDIEPLTPSQKPGYLLGEIYMSDRAQWLHRVDSRDKWSTTPSAEKRMNPWRMLKRNYPETADVLFMCRWPTGLVNSGNSTTPPNQVIPEEANITPDDFVPGRLPTAQMRTDGKAWRDPHNPFQARAWRDALLSYGSSAGALIRKSEVRWGVNSSSGAFANPGAARPGMSAWAEQVFNAAVAHAGYPNG